jgi:hypothetical protein
MNLTFETQKPAETTDQDVYSSDYSIENHRIAVNLLAVRKALKALVLTLGHSGPWHHLTMDRSARRHCIRLEHDDCALSHRLQCG